MFEYYNNLIIRKQGEEMSTQDIQKQIQKYIIAVLKASALGMAK